ncbi:MAG TPA: 4,5-DOPA dioxygenase extradiol [Usitatibacter sp.]|nr:4,5-DOPA dioxygenase extradiol [Usitatibacter sp.]
MTAPFLQPAAFIGHGSPMNTLETNRFTAAWRAFGESVPRPRAVLAVSAHWYINGTAVTAMSKPRVIHDFFGFPPELFAFDYPAPGAPHVAAEVAEVLKPQYVGLDTDSWGIDHGTWSVLAHVFPKADVPVVQLSIHAGKDIDYHVELGRRLAPLRSRGVMIIGSGNVVHNLGRIDFRRPDLAYDWGERFDAEVRQIMTASPGQLARAAAHPDYAPSVPTDEHFLPLAYLAGLCDDAGEPAQPLVEGCTMGSISMTSYTLGSSGRAPGVQTGEGAAPLPDPRVIPPEETNT